MKIHYGRMPKTDREERDNCRIEQERRIMEESVSVKERRRCPVCNQLKSIANKARRKRRCKEKYSMTVEEWEDED